VALVAVELELLKATEILEQQIQAAAAAVQAQGATAQAALDL
jgi:hypothetical protein